MTFFFNWRGAASVVIKGDYGDGLTGFDPLSVSNNNDDGGGDDDDEEEEDEAYNTPISNRRR